MSTYINDTMKFKVIILLNSESSKYIAKLFFPQYISNKLPLEDEHVFSTERLLAGKPAYKLERVKIMMLLHVIIDRCHSRAPVA